MTIEAGRRLITLIEEFRTSIAWRLDQEEAGAGHFDFMAPCPEGLARVAPAIGGISSGFDRIVFHARFDAEVIRFMTDAFRP